MKFEVGKRYKYHETIIEITEKAGKRYYFNVVKGPDNGFPFFDEKSPYASDLAPVNECIMIYRKDNKVIALDKTTGNKGIAKCSPEDEFNFNFGAKLAFERLMDDTPEKFENGKTYVFDAVKFIKDIKNQGETNLRMHSWALDVDGKEVKIRDSEYGSVDGYNVAAQWCREVKKPKKHYSGKVVFVKSNTPIFASGHIYKIIDGEIIRPAMKGVCEIVLPARDDKFFDSLDDVKEYFKNCELIEVTED